MIAIDLHWILPQRALDYAYQELAADGALDREGIALWAGTAQGSDVRVTHVLLLRGPGVVRKEGYIGIAPDLLNQVTDALSEIDGDVYLVGQIHGHPPRVSTDLSDVDIAYGIRAPNYLSVVAPNYGMSPVPRLEECGVHVFTPSVGWRRLLPSEVASRVSVVHLAAATVECIRIGDDQHG